MISANAFTTRLTLSFWLRYFIFLALILTILQMDTAFLSCTIWFISSFSPGLWNRGIQCITKKHLNLLLNHFDQTIGTSGADLSNTQFICKLPRTTKGFVLANVDFVLHAPNRFWIYSSIIQHIVENYHCPTIWFSTCSKKVVHLVDYVPATFSKVIKLKYLWPEFVIIFRTTMHWSHYRNNHDILFLFRIFSNSIWCYEHVFFFFFVMTCHTEFFSSSYIK